MVGDCRHQDPLSWWLRELSGCWGVGLGIAPRENLTPQTAVSQRRMWKDPARLGLLSNTCETLEEAWVLTALPSGELGCMVGLPLLDLLGQLSVFHIKSQLVPD